MGAHLLFIGGEDHNLRISVSDRPRVARLQRHDCRERRPRAVRARRHQVQTIRLQSVLGSTL